jgi:predicted dehydrogenase
LGEKPFGVDRAANEAIQEAADAHPEIVVRCSSEFPFYPGPQRIMQLIDEKRFGKILEVDCGFMHSSDMDPEKPINWKRIVESNGEYGCMGDLGLHVLHLPLRAGWAPRTVSAILSNIARQRKDADGNWVPCRTWDNAILLCEVEHDHSPFPLTAKMQRIAPGEMNTWYLSVKGSEMSARFSTKFPRTLETLVYKRGAAQGWQREDLGFESVYKTITGGIFEFGFTDAMQQMIAAFCEQVIQGNFAAVPFGCATLEETRQMHSILSAALESHKTKQTVAI